MCNLNLQCSVNKYVEWLKYINIDPQLLAYSMTSVNLLK